MRARKLPGTALETTELGFGAAALGNLYTPVADGEAESALEEAWRTGIRTFDVAPHYGLGLAERRLGDFLRTKPRDEFVLSTKVGRLLLPLPPATVAGRDLESGFDVAADVRRVWDFTADGVHRSLEHSLGRLGLDRIDIVLVHDPDEYETDALRSAFPALLALRAEGMIGAVGAGMNQSAMLARFVQRVDLDVILLAGRYDLLDQTALDDVLPAATRTGTSIMLGGVFGSGLLAQDWPRDDATYNYRAAPRRVLQRARRLAEICREHGTTLPAAALQFGLAHESVVSVMVGMRSAAEVRSNSALLNPPVPDSLWRALKQAGLLQWDAATPLAP